MELSLLSATNASAVAAGGSRSRRGVSPKLLSLLDNPANPFRAAAVAAPALCRIAAGEIASLLSLLSTAGALAALWLAAGLSAAALLSLLSALGGPPPLPPAAGLLVGDTLLSLLSAV